MIALSCLILLAAADAKESAFPLKPGWRETSSLASEFATQAAAADDKHYYAISSTTVAQYDRANGKLIAKGTAADAKHLNSAFVQDGKVYCAHSNYPAKPDESDIRVFDPTTGKLTTFHAFQNPPGSIVWCLVRDKEWWCCFAHYGQDNAKTLLIRFDKDWKEIARWTFPRKVIDDWDGMSASGGVFDGDTLLVSHHHFKVLYRLKIPAMPGELEFVEALQSPYPGQGIATDPKTNGLIGIDRAKKTVLFAKKVKP